MASPLDAPYRPLLHRVEYAEPADQRINAIFFLRDYEAGGVGASTTHLEIHAFNNTVVSQPCWLVSANEDETATADPGSAEASSGQTSDAEEELSYRTPGADDEDGLVFDWSSTDLPDV
mmetsp:Transcript_30259/g.53676  ORF Transcript_30259/g.53676 Transcript_30259/m.53676 type:complete len:119 (-) Transcript_30259:2-358(-)